MRGFYVQIDRNALGRSGEAARPRQASSAEQRCRSPSRPVSLLDCRYKMLGSPPWPNNILYPEHIDVARKGPDTPTAPSEKWPKSVIWTQISL
jgi:hypothetical protein